MEQGRADEATHAVAELHRRRGADGTVAGVGQPRGGSPGGTIGVRNPQEHLEDTVDLFKESGAPFETGRAWSEARVLGALGRPESAVDEARLAIDDLTPLGASLGSLARACSMR